MTRALVHEENDAECAEGARTTMPIAAVISAAQTEARSSCSGYHGKLKLEDDGASNEKQCKVDGPRTSMDAPMPHIVKLSAEQQARAKRASLEEEEIRALEAEVAAQATACQEAEYAAAAAAQVHSFQARQRWAMLCKTLLEHACAHALASAEAELSECIEEASLAADTWHQKCVTEWQANARQREEVGLLGNRLQELKTQVESTLSKTFVRRRDSLKRVSSKEDDQPAGGKEVTDPRLMQEELTRRVYQLGFLRQEAARSFCQAARDERLNRVLLDMLVCDEGGVARSLSEAASENGSDSALSGVSEEVVPR